MTVMVLASLFTAVGASGPLRAYDASVDTAGPSLWTAAHPLSAMFTASLSINPSQSQEGNSINLQTTVNGGAAPYSFTYHGLPSGCNTQNSSGFSCNPSATGMYPISGTVTDHNGNQTGTNVVTLDVTSSSNGGGGGGGSGNNSSNPLSSLLSGFGGILTYVLIFGIVGFATWILLIVGVWVIAVVLMRRLPKRGEGAPATASVRCASCSASIPAGTKFCPECGKSPVVKSP